MAKRKKADKKGIGLFDEIKREIKNKPGKDEKARDEKAYLQPARRDKHEQKMPTAAEIRKKIEAYSKGRKKRSEQEMQNFRYGLRKRAEKIKSGTETKEFIKTNIPGFDALLEKGIPKNSSVLVAGGPGTGKTIFCLQLLANAFKSGKKCLYISFEESEESLKKHMQDFGWNPEKWVNEGSLAIKRVSPYELSRSVEALLAKAKGELLIEFDGIPAIVPKDFNPEIVIVDSLSAVAAAFVEREDTYRIYIEQFFRLLEKMNVTSFLITETGQEAVYSRSGVEEFLADGVVALYHIRKENVRVRGIEIIKLRGAKHVEKLVPFEIVTGKGIVAYPEEEIFV